MPNDDLDLNKILDDTKKENNKNSKKENQQRISNHGIVGAYVIDPTKINNLDDLLDSIMAHVHEEIDNNNSNNDNNEPISLKSKNVKDFIKSSSFDVICTKDEDGELEYSHIFASLYEKNNKHELLEFNKINASRKYSLSKKFRETFINDEFDFRNYQTNAYLRDTVVELHVKKFKEMFNITDNKLFDYLDNYKKCILMFEYEKDIENLFVPVMFYNDTYENLSMLLLYLNNKNNFKLYKPAYCNDEVPVQFNDYKPFDCFTVKTAAALRMFSQRLNCLIDYYKLMFKPLNISKKYTLNNLGYIKYNNNGKNIIINNVRYLYIGTFRFNDSEISKDFKSKFNVKSEVDMYVKMPQDFTRDLYYLYKIINFNATFPQASIGSLDNNSVFLDLGY